MKSCHKCGAPWESPKRQPAVKEYCQSCSAYLHCCLNCRFHDPSAHNQCFIPNTDWVGDRSGANFCDQFEFAEREKATGEEELHRKARAKLDQILGGSTEKHPKNFDDLFKQ